MIRLYSWIILFNLGIFAQEYSYQNVAKTLKECYEDSFLLEKDNRLPNTLNVLIAILQKIENNTRNDNIGLESLAVSIMHKYRQDGIEENPTVIKKNGILPYRLGFQGQKYLQIRRLIPEKDSTLEYNKITPIERCTLHFMLSSSCEVYQRGDEGTVCRYASNAYRRERRSVGKRRNHSAKANLDHDVETLTPEQIDIITNHKDGVTEDVIDPNALYPELPPNHPGIARVLALPPRSKCPVENGVIKTNWGAVSAGSVLAGIAAGLQPETVRLSEIFEEAPPERKEYLSKITINNKWFATVAGDLAEVVLMQGPMNEKFSVGVYGNWNSSFLPRWYFLNSDEKLQFTTAEVRGDLDGLILANGLETTYSKVPNLKLSQILDMYYSTRGFLNPSIRACDRKTLFDALAQNSTMSAEAYAASLILKHRLNTATMDDEVIEKFAVEAGAELSKYISTSLKSNSCENTRNFNDNIQAAVDLTIILDTTWPYHLVQKIIATILDNVQINQYNSQFTIINGHDGNIIMNTTSSILDFYYYNYNYYNATNMGNGTSPGSSPGTSSGPLDLPKALEQLSVLQKKKLEDERHTFGRARSDVVLIVPYTSVLSATDKDFCIEQIRTMREQVPDATLLILTYEPKDRWTDLVSDPRDIFSTRAGEETPDSYAEVISRIKQVPQRLINTQCGADYSVSGETISFENYIEPGTIVQYRLHPNYFFSSDSGYTSTITITGSGWGEIKVCTSRQYINVNSTDVSATCTSINSNEHTHSFSCGDAGVIHRCEPLFVSLIANSSQVTNYQCTNPTVCRFPHMIKYTVSFKNLVCVSSANINMLNIIVLIISVIYIFL